MNTTIFTEKRLSKSTEIVPRCRVIASSGHTSQHIPQEIQSSVIDPSHVATLNNLASFSQTLTQFPQDTQNPESVFCSSPVISLTRSISSSSFNVAAGHESIAILCAFEYFLQHLLLDHILILNPHILKSHFQIIQHIIRN